MVSGRFRIDINVLDRLRQRRVTRFEFTLMKMHGNINKADPSTTKFGVEGHEIL